MKQILQISILVILTSCSQNQKEKRDTSVYMDGEKIEVKTTTILDSINFELDTSYAHNQKIKSESGVGIVQEDPTKSERKIDDPIAVIDRIFTTYNEFEESTDSPSNLELITTALEQLEDQIESKDLTLIIDVWMYYTVTDFSTREKTEKVFLAHKQASIHAVKERMKNKKEWETENSAPFSELEYLLEKLEKNKK